MLKIRLQRIGRRNNPSYRVVVVDSRKAAKKGRAVELLGQHDTIRKKTVLHKERINYWVDQGAQVSDTMHNLLVNNGVIDKQKKNVLPKKSPPAVQEEKIEQESKEKSEAVSTPEDNDTVENENTQAAAESKVEETESQEDTKQHPSGES